METDSKSEPAIQPPRGFAAVRHAVETLRHGAFSKDDLYGLVAKVLKKHGNGARKISDLDPAHYEAVIYALREAWARRLIMRGAIFPVTAEGKSPWSAHGYLDATRDMKQARQWLRDKPNCNFGLTGVGLIDIDVRNNGQEFWKQFVAEHGGGVEPDTLMAVTPTGGNHYIVPDRLQKHDLGPGVEVPNYIVAPGSHVTANGKDCRATGFYSWANQKEIRSIPWLVELAGAKQDSERAAAQYQIPAVEMDSAENVAWGTHYLLNDARPSIEGQGGEHQTLLVAAVLKDRGISEHMAGQLMAEHYNPRCEPPWQLGDCADADNLMIKIRNAYSYCVGSPPGSVTPEAEFEGDPPEPLPEVSLLQDGMNEPPRRKITATPFNAADWKVIKPRDILYGSHYFRKYVTGTVSPGGMGKSTEVLAEAVSMVTGFDLLKTGRTYPRPLKVWYWNGEDPREETARRLTAICRHYGRTNEEADSKVLGTDHERFDFGIEDLDGKLFVDTGRETPIKIATLQGGTAQIAKPVVADLVATIMANQIDVLIIDPFVSSHSITENDNVQIDMVIKDGWAQVAEQGNCAVELVHHTRKIAPGASYSAADARGASANIDGWRDGRVLNVMSYREAAEFKIDQGECWRFFRVDSDKRNMAPRGGATPWRYLVSVNLHNAADGLPADSVGVATPWSPPKDDPIKIEVENKKITDFVAGLVAAGKRIAKTHGGDFRLKDIPALMKAKDPECSVTVSDVQAALDAAIAAGSWVYTTGSPHKRAGYDPAGTAETPEAPSNVVYPEFGQHREGDPEGDPEAE